MRPDEAQRVVEQLQKGESFAALARKVSIDPSAESGGLLGRMALSAMRPELRGAVQGLGVGQVTDVIQVPTGFAAPASRGRWRSWGDDQRIPTANPVVAAVGSVKYVLAVGGLVEAQA